MRYYLLLCITVFFLKTSAQSNPREHISSFNVTTLTYKHDPRWMLYMELQGRGIEDYSKMDYYELKGGVGYNIVKNNQALLGVGKYVTYRNSRIYQEELRVWLQYILSHNIYRAKIDHRVRAEKRFFDYPQTNTKDNTERYRYRLTATLPLNKSKIEPGTFFANAFDEVFVGPELPTFKRNRIFGGLGYVFSNSLSSNLGYLWQRDFGASSNRNLHFLYFALNFTIDRKQLNESHNLNVAD